MHYSFIIANRLGQIDLHFEPNAVFSDLNSQMCFVPNIDSDSNNGYDTVSLECVSMLRVHMDQNPVLHSHKSNRDGVLDFL